jgi:cytochrome c-type biogenesis protein CcmH
VKRLVLVAAVALLLVPSALASDRHPTMNELENEIMCPVCNTTLAQSDSPAAHQIERDIRGRIRQGWTKTQIEDYLVGQYGESILASPPKRGFNLLAWLLPLGGVGVAAVLLGIAAWGWSRGRPEHEISTSPSLNGQGPIDPELERRVDEELARID